MKINQMLLPSLLISSVLIINETQCGNILGVFTFKLKSHTIIYQSIMTELARRGHNVTVISPFPVDQAPVNFTDIDISDCRNIPLDFFTIEKMYQNQNPFSIVRETFEVGRQTSQSLHECEPINQFLKTNDSYDLVITEFYVTDITLGFVGKFKTSHVAFYASPLFPWTAVRMGNPSNPSYIPYPFNDKKFDIYRPTFYQRLYNTLFHLSAQILQFYYSYSYDNENSFRKVFGPHAPGIEEIAKNTSLILSFSHFSINTPRALIPGVIQVAGAQIKEVKPLPKDIQKFIDESEYGVIYFCMGSLLKPRSFPESKRTAFLEAFSKLPQRIIWRWDGDLPGKTDKIFTSKWIPQRDILAHPKVKLFLSHGGALGLTEAIHEAVPVLGIPIFADQMMNLGVLQTYGVAEILHYPDINNETVLAKITQVLQSSYSTNMRKLSEIFKDRPMSAMNTAIYWIEYVIRHKGARHLRSAAADMLLYQYLLLDVIVFLLTVAISVIIFIHYVSKKCLSLRARRKPSLYLKKGN